MIWRRVYDAPSLLICLMSPFMEMEWNAKWDWENLVACSKGIESPKNLQLVDWTIVDDGEIHVEPFNMSAGSSTKSSISASTDSSCKKIEINGIELSGTSPTPETSVGSAEALLGLKLGKRKYFENNNGNVKSTSFSVVPNPSITTPKKTRSSVQNVPICCQVEGCNADLLLAKEYHRKHRVCDAHSKCPKVIVEGRERRFCQQCSRFHGLCEFDERKRSCRRRLSDHNARRRKPHQETIQFNSPRLSPSFYGTQQMNFLMNNSPVVEARALANSAWNSSRFTLTKGCSFKSDGEGVADEIKALNMQNAANGFFASKDPASMVLNPVSKGSVMPSLDPEYRRALSLLSSDSCIAQESIQLSNENNSGVGISSEFWPHHQLQSFNADFYSNLLN